MSVDAEYKPISYIYKSRGLIARNISDQAPEYTYLQLLNCLEREEEAMSSRYGTQIINRDNGVFFKNNHFFTAPVTSLSRLNYQTSAWRYAGTSDGNLYRRAGNFQGAYTQIYSGLSGKPFQSLVTNCFETSIPYNFIYDQAASVKDNGTLAAPQLTGIDPSPYTANSVPYSPLLTLIDNFAAGNTYSTNTAGFTYSTITAIPTGMGTLVTDFPQFVNVSGTTYTIAGGSATASGTTPGGHSNIVPFSGFTSVAITPIETVTLSVNVSGSGSYTGTSFGVVDALYQYSIDGGVTWTNFFNYNYNGNVNQVFSPQTVTFAVNGLTNLSTLQVRIDANIAYTSGTGTISVTGNISGIQASVTNPGIFGDVCNGILSVLNTNTSINVPIVSIVSSSLVSGAYLSLTVTTATPHGLSLFSEIAIYGASNDLVDGFYRVSGALTATTFTVPFYSVAQLGSLGGVVTGGAAAPSTCVLINEYAAPYPTQFSAWGFYQQVPVATSSFPVGNWSGTAPANSNTFFGNTANINLNINNQATDDDLIVITLNVGTPANIDNIRLEFDVNSSGYTSTYYYKDISPAYYQGGVDQSETSYQVTENQILADTLGLITGAPPGTTTAQVQPGNFSTGPDAWIAIYLRRGDFLPVGQAGQSGLDWTNVTGWQLDITTNTGGSSTVAVNGLYFQWGYGPSSFGGVGYDYRYTYYNAFTGTESNPSPEQKFGGTQFGYLASQSAPIYLRQAVQIVGQYSFDTQVTHVRIYRRGGTLNSNWVQIDQIPNNSAGGFLNFIYKDVIPDAFVQQAQILVLDNDPPVTSSLSSPIQTTLAAATSGPGNTFYSIFSPQLIAVADNTATFVVNQLVDIGTSSNLEIVAVITGGVGQFTAMVRLQHNQGEPVSVYAIPRQPCNLCAFAYNQVWLAGDPNNPHYLYYAKKGLPENFGPQNYIPVSTPDDPINAVINWRGTLIVGTLKTWKIIVGGPSPYAQPTGSVHGIIAQGGWAEVEGAVWYRAADGLREFTGADGVYKTLPIEWIYRLNPQCIPPQADPTQAAQDVMAYYNNAIYTSYISLSNSGQRYRMNYDTQYARFRYDDVGATAMLWEKDINTLLAGVQIGVGEYAIVQDQVGDYDDGGWDGSGNLIQTPINLTIQSPYRDLGKPHFPKQWNMYETDVNTQNQVMQSTLLFEDGTITVPLANANTGTTRQKVELIVNNGDGQQAYRASILHTMAVTVAPTIYQEDINAAILAEYSASIDTYWIKFGTDESKFVKQGYFDYTSSVAIDVSLYADNSATPYFTFVLPVQAVRAIVRVRFGNLNNGTTAFTLRTWRMIALTGGSAPPTQFQMWQAPRIEWKPIGAGNSYRVKELEV